MRQIRRYFMNTNLQAILIVMAILIVLNFLSVIVDQSGDIEGDYNFVQVLLYALWRIPGFIDDNIVFAALIGCLIGLGMLATSNELTVIRASGVSLKRILWLVMRPVLVVIVLGMGVGELSSYTDRIAEGSRALALQGTRQEWQVWNREENEFIRFDTVLPNGKVYGIARFAFEGRQLVSIQYAREGTYERSSWLMEGVETHYFKDDFTFVDKQQTERWQTRLTPEMLTYLSTEPENLTMPELYRYAAFLSEQEVDNRSYWLSFWKKIARPLEIFSLILIAISFVFGPLRQVTMGYRIFSGVIVGVVFQTIQDISGASSLVFGFSPLLAVLVPILACCAIGLGLLSRVR